MIFGQTLVKQKKEFVSTFFWFSVFSIRALLIHDFLYDIYTIMDCEKENLQENQDQKMIQFDTINSSKLGKPSNAV